jgi:tRNA-splicing ligase RtcB
MSRTKGEACNRKLQAELEALAVTIYPQSRAGMAEEMPDSYKDVADVVQVLEAAHVTQRVARLRPFAVIKGERSRVHYSYHYKKT